MVYLLDTSVFITAKNAHYGFEFCPAFWDWLTEANGKGTAKSVDAVFRELCKGKDGLSKWARDHRSMFLKPTRNDLKAMNEVHEWATKSTFYGDAAKHGFKVGADSYLIGQSLRGDHVIVTHEKSSDGQRTIKIPDAAEAIGIEVIDPFEMLRREKPRFVLEGLRKETSPNEPPDPLFASDNHNRG